jgi:predicted ATPase
MIKRMWARNYRSLADVDVDLERLTVFVGLNGSGKSNLVDALRFISDALKLGLDSAVRERGGIDYLRRWQRGQAGRRSDIEVGLSIEAQAMAGEYSFTLSSGPRGEYRVKEELCTLDLDNYSAEVGFGIKDGTWVRRPSEIEAPISTRALVLPLLASLERYQKLYRFLTGMGFYNLIPKELTKPQAPTNAYPLEDRGENLASFLEELNTARQDEIKFRRGLEDALRRATGDITGYKVNRAGGFLIINLRHQHADIDESGPSFPLAQESDGTLRILGILAALYQEPPRTLITIEEPELTIHPGAMSVLWEEIEIAAERSQIILTTHSPDLLDMCRAEQLRVVEKVKGITEVGPIAEEQRQIIQERLFAPGQLLRAQGLHRVWEE